MTILNGVFFTKAEGPEWLLEKSLSLSMQEKKKIVVPK